MPTLNPFKKRTPSPRRITTAQRSAIAIIGCVLILSGFAIYNGLVTETSTAIATLKIALGVSILLGSTYTAFRFKRNIMTALTKTEPDPHPDQPAPARASEDPP